jgi:hypothetical protein
MQIGELLSGLFRQSDILIILGLIGLDFVAAVSQALRNRTFDARRLSDFLCDNGSKFMVYFAIDFMIALMADPQVKTAMESVRVPIFAAFTGALGWSFAKNASAIFGIELTMNQVIGKFKPPVQ